MAQKKLDVTYGWREKRRPHEWQCQLYCRSADGHEIPVRPCQLEWFTRQELEIANRRQDETRFFWKETGEHRRPA